MQMFESWLAIDWSQMLIPHHPLEVMVRGTIAYLGLLIILRGLLKRQPTSLSLSDLLVTVLIADALQNGMAGEYRSVTDGLLLVCTLLFWDLFVDWLAFRSATIERLVSPPPTLLIYKGKMITRNLRREFIREEELHSKLREAGVEHFTDVKKAFLENDGNISIIRNA